MASTLASHQKPQEFTFADQQYFYYLAEDAQGLERVLQDLATEMKGDFKQYVLFMIKGADPNHPYEALIMVCRHNDQYEFWHRNLLDRPALKEKVMGTIDRFLQEQTAAKQTMAACFHDLYKEKGGRGEMLRSLTDPGFFSSEHAGNLMSSTLLPRDEILAQTFEIFATKGALKKISSASVSPHLRRGTFFAATPSHASTEAGAIHADHKVVPSLKK